MLSPRPDLLSIHPLRSKLISHQTAIIIYKDRKFLTELIFIGNKSGCIINCKREPSESAKSSTMRVGFRTARAFAGYFHFYFFIIVNLIYIRDISIRKTTATGFSRKKEVDCCGGERDGERGRGGVDGRRRLCFCCNGKMNCGGHTNGSVMLMYCE